MASLEMSKDSRAQTDNARFDRRTAFRRIGSIALALLALAAFLFIAERNYLAFHVLAEFSSVAVAWAIFMMAWPARRISSNDYVLFLGIAYLGVGTLDLFHTMFYKGMGIFLTATTDEPTQLWIGARYMESLALLWAPTFLSRRVPVPVVASVVFALTAGLLSLILWTDIFPTCHVAGEGLTVFKRVSEYLICGIAAVAIWRMHRARAGTDVRLHRLVIASLALTILAELSFTAYVSVYGGANQLGHLFKLASFYLIYVGVIHNGLNRPYEVLFADLTRSEETSRRRNDELIVEVEHREKTERKLRSINEEISASRAALEQRIAQTQEKNRDLVVRYSENVMHRAEAAKQLSLTQSALAGLRDENEVLRDQLSSYVQLFEQTRVDLDDLLSPEERSEDADQTNRPAEKSSPPINSNES